MKAQVFAVHLSSPEDLREDERRLRRAVWPEGHDVWRTEDGEGRWFLAVRVNSPQPAQELERLMRRAGLRGYFAPLSA
jgi:hypothetical protein